MSRHTRFGQFARQRLALLLALICFWISGVATLHHAGNDHANCLTYQTHHASVHQALAITDDGPCLACEWEQTFSELPAYHLIILPQGAIRNSWTPSLNAALHLVAFDAVSLRGPPASF